MEGWVGSLTCNYCEGHALDSKPVTRDDGDSQRHQEYTHTKQAAELSHTKSVQYIAAPAVAPVAAAPAKRCPLPFASRPRPASLEHR